MPPLAAATAALAFLLAASCTVGDSDPEQTISTEAEATALRPWSSWYPLDRGQREGERALNFWSHPGKMEFRAQSTWNVPGVPNSLPPSFGGEAIDYFYNWTCSTPTCETLDVGHREIMSEGASSYDLQHWARGAGHWQVFYRPDAFEGDCRESAIRQRFSRADLENSDRKAPLVLRLPLDEGASAFGPPVCALLFNGVVQDPAKLIDGRHNAAEEETHERLQTGMWFAETKLLDEFLDRNGRKILRVRNIYYTDNQLMAAVFRDNLYRVYGEQSVPPELDKLIGQTRSVRLPGGGILEGTAFSAETYAMREVLDPMTNGYGSFFWYTWHGDQIHYDVPEQGGDQQWTMQHCERTGSTFRCE